MTIILKKIIFYFSIYVILIFLLLDAGDAQNNTNAQDQGNTDAQDQGNTDTQNNVNVPDVGEEEDDEINDDETTGYIESVSFC